MRPQLFRYSKQTLGYSRTNEPAVRRWPRENRDRLLRTDMAIFRRILPVVFCLLHSACGDDASDGSMRNSPDAAMPDPSRDGIEGIWIACQIGDCRFSTEYDVQLTSQDRTEDIGVLDLRPGGQLFLLDDEARRVDSDGRPMPRPGRDDDQYIPGEWSVSNGSLQVSYEDVSLTFSYARTASGLRLTFGDTLLYFEQLTPLSVGEVIRTEPWIFYAVSRSDDETFPLLPPGADADGIYFMRFEPSGAFSVIEDSFGSDSTCVWSGGQWSTEGSTVTLVYPDGRSQSFEFDVWLSGNLCHDDRIDASGLANCSVELSWEDEDITPGEFAVCP